MVGGLAFPGSSADKNNLPAMQETWVQFLGDGNGNPLQYSCLENPHGQKSLVGDSPWGHRESDSTETNHSPAQPIRLPKWALLSNTS